VRLTFFFRNGMNRYDLIQRRPSAPARLRRPTPKRGRTTDEVIVNSPSPSDLNQKPTLISINRSETDLRNVRRLNVRDFSDEESLRSDRSGWLEVDEGRGRDGKRLRLGEKKVVGVEGSRNGRKKAKERWRKARRIVFGILSVDSHGGGSGKGKAGMKRLVFIQGQVSGGGESKEKILEIRNETDEVVGVGKGLVCRSEVA
jgi:hypothetical protein